MQPWRECSNLLHIANICLPSRLLKKAARQYEAAEAVIVKVPGDTLHIVEQVGVGGDPEG